MVTRREINSKHEIAVIEAAVIAHNQVMGTSFSVVSRPDPPDAILFDGYNNSWIEHTDAFYPGWAEHLTSYAATDKPHKPMKKSGHMDMDNIIADTFARVVLKKFKNKCYTPVVEKYGPGILVVGLESPWLDEESIHAINQNWIELGNPNLSSVFKWVYLGYRINNENKATPWLIDTKPL